MVGHMAGPGPAGSADLGLKYDHLMCVLARPGLDILFAGRAGPGPHNSICGPGPGLVCIQRLRARARPGPQIIFADRAWASISGPCRALVERVKCMRIIIACVV